jgi:hypothetical protein
MPIEQVGGAELVAAEEVDVVVAEGDRRRTSSSRTS